MTTNKGSTSTSTQAVNSTTGNGSNITTIAAASATTRLPKGLREELQQLLAGVNAILTEGSSLLTEGGGQLGKADITQTLSGGVAAYAAVDTQAATPRQSRVQLRAGSPVLRAFCAQLKADLIHAFGKGSPLLSQCGIGQKKLALPRTPVQKLAAATKAQQTRALRHTMGRKQRSGLQFTGQVTVSTNVNPPAAPASQPSATPSPAPNSGTPVRRRPQRRGVSHSRAAWVTAARCSCRAVRVPGAGLARDLFYVVPMGARPREPA